MLWLTGRIRVAQWFAPRGYIVRPEERLEFVVKWDASQLQAIIDNLRRELEDEGEEWKRT